VSNDKESSFSRTLNQEKHERIARHSLHDLVLFHEALETEIERVRALDRGNSDYIPELLEKMLIIQKQYHIVMQGFRELTAEQEQHALICFADAVLDLMKLIHKKRGH
jgi:hypothetical protein